MSRLKYSIFTLLYLLVLLVVVVSYVLLASTTYFYILLGVIVVLGFYTLFTFRFISLAKKYEKISELKYDKRLWMGFIAWIGFIVILLTLTLSHVDILRTSLGF